MRWTDIADCSFECFDLDHVVLSSLAVSAGLLVNMLSDEVADKRCN